MNNDDRLGIVHLINDEIFYRPLKNFTWLYIDNDYLFYERLYSEIMKYYDSKGDIPKAVYLVHKETKDMDFIVGHRTKELRGYEEL